MITKLQVYEVIDGISGLLRNKKASATAFAAAAGYGKFLRGLFWLSIVMVYLAYLSKPSFSFQDPNGALRDNLWDRTLKVLISILPFDCFEIKF